jgi:non-ribosomal peptide synthetase component E (peptide arylation enzyme)
LEILKLPIFLPTAIMFVLRTPRSTRGLSGLPLTGTGKIDKKVLKEQFKGVLK